MKTKKATASRPNGATKAASEKSDNKDKDEETDTVKTARKTATKKVAPAKKAPAKTTTKRTVSKGTRPEPKATTKTPKKQVAERKSDPNLAFRTVGVSVMFDDTYVLRSTKHGYEEGTWREKIAQVFKSKHKVRQAFEKVKELRKAEEIGSESDFWPDRRYVRIVFKELLRKKVLKKLD